MSRFLMRPAFHQFGKNWENRPNFKDAVLHGWGRLILKKSRKTKGAASGAVIANRFDPLQLILPVSAGTCNYYYARALEWKDNIHIIIRPDLFLSTSGTTTIPRFNRLATARA